MSFVGHRSDCTKIGGGGCGGGCAGSGGGGGLTTACHETDVRCGLNGRWSAIGWGVMIGVMIGVTTSGGDGAPRLIDESDVVDIVLGGRGCGSGPPWPAAKWAASCCCCILEQEFTTGNLNYCQKMFAIFFQQNDHWYEIFSKISSA